MPVKTKGIKTSAIISSTNYEYIHITITIVGYPSGAIQLKDKSQLKSVYKLRFYDGKNCTDFIESIIIMRKNIFGGFIHMFGRSFQDPTWPTHGACLSMS